MQVPRASWIPLRAIACQQHGDWLAAFDAHDIFNIKTPKQAFQ